MKKLAFTFIIITVSFLSCVSSSPVNSSLGEVEAGFESYELLRMQSSSSNQSMERALRNIISGNAGSRRIDTITVGAGILEAAAIDAVNASIRRRLTEAAHEVLLETAVMQYGENVDVNNIRFRLIGQDQYTELYQYTASGHVVPLEGYNAKK
ncbi:MAG: hypothetical protein FWB83_04795 [Treponema sp.]|nr:hypothetical protein [Treponema sp.]